MNSALVLAQPYVDILHFGLCNRDLVQLLRIKAEVQEPYARATACLDPSRSLVKVPGSFGRESWIRDPVSIPVPSTHPHGEQMVQPLYTSEKGRN